MSHEYLGDACACTKLKNGSNKYIRIGTAYKDGERISVKLDVMPLPGADWDGWINIFTDKSKRPEPQAGYPLPRPLPPFDGTDDDIPF